MKWILLIGFGVLGSLVTRVSTAELGHAAEINEDDFQEDYGALLEDAYHLFIDNDPDEEVLIDEQALDDVMLANWFKKVGHSIKSWTKKAVQDAGKWTKKAGHDAGRWTKKAEHDAGRWTKKAGHDAGKWTKKAVHDAGHAIKKGCKVVNQIPFKELVLRMNESLRQRGISEEELNEEQVAAVASGIYKGIKTACRFIH